MQEYLKKTYGVHIHSNLIIFYLLFQNFEPAPVAANEFGKFYTGDSYIVLKVSNSFCYFTVSSNNRIFNDF